MGTSAAPGGGKHPLGKTLKHLQILGKDGGIWQLCGKLLELVVLPQDWDAEVFDSCSPGCTVLLLEQSQVGIHILMKGGHRFPMDGLAEPQCCTQEAWEVPVPSTGGG